MRVWSEADRETQQTRKKGGRNFAISKRFKRKTIGKIVVLDFLPKEDRPGGHTGEEDPLVGLPSLKLFSFLVFYSRIPVCVIRFKSERKHYDALRHLFLDLSRSFGINPSILPPPFVR